MSNTKTMLEDEIREMIEAIGKLEIGSDKHKAASESLVKLLDKYNDMDRLDLEYQEKCDDREENRIMKEKELEHHKHDAFVKNVLTGVSIGGGFIMTIWGTWKSINFERTGSFTTIAGREFVKKIFNWRR